MGGRSPCGVNCCGSFLLIECEADEDLGYRL